MSYCMFSKTLWKKNGDMTSGRRSLKFFEFWGIGDWWLRTGIDSFSGGKIDVFAAFLTELKMKICYQNRYSKNQKKMQKLRYI